MTKETVNQRCLIVKAVRESSGTYIMTFARDTFKISQCPEQMVAILFWNAIWNTNVEFLFQFHRILFIQGINS